MTLCSSTRYLDVFHAYVCPHDHRDCHLKLYRYRHIVSGIFNLKPITLYMYDNSITIRCSQGTCMHLSVKGCKNYKLANISTLTVRPETVQFWNCEGVQLYGTPEHLVISPSSLVNTGPYLQWLIAYKAKRLINQMHVTWSLQFGFMAHQT